MNENEANTDMMRERINSKINIEKAKSIFFDLSSDMLCIADFNGYLKEANKSFLQFSGYTKTELTSNKFFHFIDTPYTHQIEETFYAALEKDTAEFTARWQLKNNINSPLRFCLTVDKENCLVYIHLKKWIKDTSEILESISDAFFAIDRNWIITYWNQKAQEFLNKDRETVLGESLLECYPHEIGKGFYNQYVRAMEEQVTVHFEEYLEEVDKWFEVNAYPSPEGLSVYFKDVSKRKKYETELTEFSKRMDYALKANSGAVWDYSIDKKESFLPGDSFKNLFGYDIQNHILTSSFWEQELIHPDDRSRVTNSFADAIEQKADYWSEQYRFKKANGAYAYVLDRGYVMKDKNGKPERIIGSIEDITPEKQIEEALQESEKNYKRLFNSAPIPFFIYDVNTLAILEANETATKLYGFTHEEMLQMTMLQLRPQEDYEKFKHFINNLVPSQSPANAIWTHLKKNGEAITIEAANNYIIYKDNPAILAAIFDITERLKLENKLADLKISQQKSVTQATIKGQEKERAELGRDLHDNINQVLTTTKLYLDLAEANEDLRKELIAKSKKHLLHTIGEIRSLSKSLVPPSLEDISLSDSIQEVIDSYRITTPIQFHYIFNQKVNLLAKDLQTSFYRIVQEQLNNIIKYASAENVWVEFAMGRGTIKIKIADDGQGFELSKKRMGIGLSNIKNRVELYDGTIDIKSSPGNGCVIKILIPYQHSDEQDEVHHIFIGEDSEDDQVFLKNAFEDVAPQHILTFASNGSQLMQLLHALPPEEQPSLIVLDYNMPISNGLETLMALQVEQRFINVPKIIYSTSSSPLYKNKSLSANATAYMQKGVTIAEIKEDVQQMLSLIKTTT